MRLFGGSYAPLLLMLALRFDPSPPVAGAGFLGPFSPRHGPARDLASLCRSVTRDRLA
jgi:hypothetical protein